MNSDISSPHRPSPLNLCQDLTPLIESWGIAPHELGIIVVDHGSRRAASNEALLDVVQLFQTVTQFARVEPAHMELAEPSIADAFARLVQQGAKLIVVHPYFLSPGRHWHKDIPQLVAEAAALHPRIRHLVTAPLGIHQLMPMIMADRIQQCLSHAAGKRDACELCRDGDPCAVRTS